MRLRSQCLAGTVLWEGMRAWRQDFSGQGPNIQSLLERRGLIKLQKSQSNLAFFSYGYDSTVQFNAFSTNTVLFTMVWC